MFNNDFETATIIKIIFIIIFQRTTSVLSCLVTELFFSVVDKRTLAPKSNLHETVLQANFKERRRRCKLIFQRATPMPGHQPPE